MATLTTLSGVQAGVALTTTAATGGGDACECGPQNWLYVNNGGGSPITVTLAVPSSLSPYSGMTYTNVAVTVTNGTAKLIPVGVQFRDPVTGLCTITYSAVTSVTVAAFVRAAN